MSLSWFKFGNIDTRDYGIVVTAKDRYALPVRDYTEHQIIGRNGSIFTDNGRYKNVSIKYHCELPTEKWLGFGEQFKEFRYRLAMATGYQELTDSYEEDKIRRGILVATVTPESNGPAWIIGAFDVEFSCEPQVYTDRGQKRQNIGSVIMGSIAGAESSITVNSTSGSVLRSSAMYCRTGTVTVQGGTRLTLQTTHTDHEQVMVYVAEFNSAGLATEATVVKKQWVRVPKGETVGITLQDATKYVRLCWNANTMKTTDETKQQIITVECSSGVYRYGTNRVYYNAETDFDTNPVIWIWSYGSHDAAKMKMDDVVVRFGMTSGSVDKLACDCEKEIFLDANGNSMNRICGVFGNEECTKPSAVFPMLHPGINPIVLMWETRETYDPYYTIYLVTREWEL